MIHDRYLFFSNLKRPRENASRGRGQYTGYSQTSKKGQMSNSQANSKHNTYKKGKVYSGLSLIPLHNLLVFLIHLRLELLTQFPALNDEIYFFLILKNRLCQLFINLVNISKSQAKAKLTFMSYYISYILCAKKICRVKSTKNEKIS